MRSPSRKKYKIKYFSSLSEDEDIEVDEDMEIDENTETNDDTEINDDAKADDDMEVDDDAEAVEDADSDKIESAILVLGRSMRSAVARSAFRKSLSYYIK